MKKSFLAFAIAGSLCLVSCGSEDADGKDGTEQSTGDEKDETDAVSVVGT